MEAANPQEIKPTPQGKWFKPLAHYNSFPYTTVDGDGFIKEITLPIEGINSLHITVSRGGEWWKRSVGDEQTAFYFDGEEKEIIIGEEGQRTLEEKNELRLAYVGFFAESKDPRNEAVECRVRFPSGTELVSRSRPEAYTQGGFLGTDWENPVTGKKYDRIYVPESQHLLGQLALKVSVLK